MSSSELKRVRLPLTDQDRFSLRTGEYILLSGKLYTARDAAHAKLAKLVTENKPLPMSFDGQPIYYVGATPARPGEVIGSCGPTSSYRMDQFMPALLSRGLRVTIGKGERSDATLQAMKQVGAIYLIVTGGIGALIAKTVVSSRLVAYPELQSEALFEIEVSDFPAIVAFDSVGTDIYRKM